MGETYPVHVDIQDVEGFVIALAIIVALALKAFAFVNALIWPASAYRTAGKLSKPLWLAILGAGLVAQVLLINTLPIHPVHLVATVAAIVFLVDVRPAVTHRAP